VLGFHSPVLDFLCAAAWYSFLLSAARLFKVLLAIIHHLQLFSFLPVRPRPPFLRSRELVRRSHSYHHQGLIFSAWFLHSRDGLRDLVPFFAACRFRFLLLNDFRRPEFLAHFVRPTWLHPILRGREVQSGCLLPGWSLLAQVARSIDLASLMPVCDSAAHRSLHFCCYYLGYARELFD
jgi:hypothetical protein